MELKGWPRRTFLALRIVGIPTVVIRMVQGSALRIRPFHLLPNHPNGPEPRLD